MILFDKNKSNLFHDSESFVKHLLKPLCSKNKISSSNKISGLFTSVISHKDKCDLTVSEDTKRTIQNIYFM